MDEEPTGNTPPPEPPWTLWHLLMPLWIITPGLLMLMITSFANAVWPSAFLVLLVATSMITFGMCLHVGTKLASSLRKERDELAILIWLICVSGVFALNFGIAYAGCSKMMG